MDIYEQYCMDNFYFPLDFFYRNSSSIVQQHTMASKLHEKHIRFMNINDILMNIYEKVKILEKSEKSSMSLYMRGLFSHQSY